MYELYAYFTNDGSVGLFSPEADDIYHSTYGALTEAYEKFILPANLDDLFKRKSEIKVLDICFGIGYNTKSFINKFLEILYNEAIDVDNNKYNSKVYTNNIKRKIFIHAIDNDKILANLSPFFVAGKDKIINSKLNFKQDKIKRMLSGKTKTCFRLKKETEIILLDKIKDYIDSESEKILFSKKYSVYFDSYIIGLYKLYKMKIGKYTPLRYLNAFLHNIYYKYISCSYKKALKVLKTVDLNFELNIDDARSAIKNDTQIYDLIFLDAFTPAKCPCLWTVDFFKLLYNHLDNEGMILTYSNSAAVRNAFMHAGFYIGKIYSERENKFTGTVAVKNKSLIKHDLSEFDLGLLKTKAGIFYRDKNLSALNEAIIEQHKKEVENSDLISSSRFIKQFGRKNDI